MRPSKRIAWPLVGSPAMLERVLDVAPRARRRRPGARSEDAAPAASCASVLDLVVARACRDHFAMLLVAVVDALECARCISLAPNLLLEHVLELRAEHARAPAEVRLEDLPDVHAARHAERVEHEVDRACRPARYGMSSSGQDAADDALVAVAAGHLVADLELALDGDVDLHHLDHARRQLVALGEALDLVAEVLLAGAHDLLEIAEHLLRPPRRSSTGISPQYLRGISSSVASSMRCALLEEDLALVVDELAASSSCRRGSRLIRRKNESRRILISSSRVRSRRARSWSSMSRGALVLLGALAGEDARVDDDAAHARRDPERAVADVAGLLAEDGAEELLLGESCVSPFGRDLADEDVARLHLGADAHDARARRGP